jgi:hypothetical protein
MAVQVRFRGVSLFRQRGDRVEVLIPATPPGEANGLPEHYSRFVMWANSSSRPAAGRGPDPEWHRRLAGGVVVTFSDGAGALTPCDFSRTARLNDVSGLTLKSDAQLEKPDLVVAKIILKGGALSPTNFDQADRPKDWKFPNSAKNYPQLAYELTWTAPQDELEVSFSNGQPRSAALHDGETIMVGNRPDYDLDYWHPCHDDEHGRCLPATHVSDRDFAWLYYLCENVPMSRPVPETTCPGTAAIAAEASVPRGAGSPTCFMAWWE